MSVIATLNIGANGATSLAGSSAPLSSAPDRQRFLALHRRAGLHITGRNSAISELYSERKIPLVILSRTQASERTPEAEIVNTSGGLQEAMREIALRFPAPLVIEAGPLLLMALVAAGCIDEIELSLSPIDGDGNFINIEELTSHFEIVSDENIDETRLLQGRYKGDSAYR